MHKSYWISAVLLVIAIPIWAVFLRHFSAAGRRDRAAVALLPSSVLPRDFQKTISDIELVLDNPGGAPVQAIPSLRGRQIGPSDTKHMEDWLALCLALVLAPETTDTRDWKRLGEAHVRSTGSEAVLTLPLYETPKGRLGIQHGASYHRDDSENAGKLLSFLHDARKKAVTPAHEDP